MKDEYLLKPSEGLSFARMQNRSDSERNVQKGEQAPWYSTVTTEQ